VPGVVYGYKTENASIECDEAAVTRAYTKAGENTLLASHSSSSIIQSNISIIGTGQTPFGEHWDKSIRDLMEDAVEKALGSAPCTALDIDLVIVANMIGELVNGQAHLGSIASSLLPHHPPALRVESACGSGAFALHTACAMLESGRAQTVLERYCNGAKGA
jgi:3-oxoacyl-[acyl-carrier-protein] synthase III